MLPTKRMVRIVVWMFLAAMLLPAGERFRFAHLSDLHIGSATGAEDLRRSVADLNGLTDIDFAVITGDITEFGADEQFRLAKQILDSLRMPWSIVPGNHDMKWSASGGTTFPKIFGAERFVFDHHGYRFIGLHQGPRMRMGDAYWTTDDVMWLDSTLRSMRGTVRRAFIATHYPADSGIANWRNVTDVANRYNVQAFLNGHWHRNFSGTFEGIPSIVGRSNLRAKDPVGGYNIATIDGDTLTYATRIPGDRTLPPWTRLILSNRTEQPKRPNASMLVADQHVRTRTKIESRIPMYCPPLVTDGYHVFAYGDGSIRISPKKGKEFTIRVPGAVMATPAIEKDRLIIACTDSAFHCYDLGRRKWIWRLRTGAALVAPPVIRDGVVYSGSSDRIFRAFRVSDGSLLWSFDSLAGHVEVKATVTDSSVIFGAWDEHLYCLDRSTGRRLWSWIGDHRGTLLSPAVCEPVVSHGTVFIVAPDRYMTALDLQTGKERWRTGQFQVRETIGGSEDGERIYIRTMNDSVYALSASSEIPTIVWRVNAGFGYDINSSQIREKDGTVFITTKNGLLLALNAKDGMVRWTFKEGNVIAHTPIPISGRRVLFSNILGTVMDVEGK